MGISPSKKTDDVPDRHNRRRKSSIVDPNKPFLLAVTLGEILRAESKRPVYTVQPNDTLQAVLKLFKEKGISSAPVIEGTVRQKDFKVDGTISLLDMAYFILATSAQQFKSDIYIDGVQKDHLPDTSIAKIMDFSKKSPFVALYCSSPFPTAVELFQQGVHRAVVFVDESLELFAVFSQTDAINYLVKIIKEQREPILNQWCSRTLRDVGFKPHAVSSISLDESVGDAVEQMVKGHSSTLALLEDTMLVGTFSSNELRYLEFGAQYTAMLNMSLREYLSRFSPASLHPATISVADSLEHAMNLLVQNRLHHVYVVDTVGRRRSSISVVNHAPNNNFSGSASSPSPGPASGSGSGSKRNSFSGATESPVEQQPQQQQQQQQQQHQQQQQAAAGSGKPSLQFRKDVIGVMTLTDVLRMGCGAVQLPKPTETSALALDGLPLSLAPAQGAQAGGAGAHRTSVVSAVKNDPKALPPQ